MKLRQEKQIAGKGVLKKYYNWISQTNFKELNTGCSGCGACSCGGSCATRTAYDYPCDCNGCSQCGMTIKLTNRILVNK